MKKMMITVGFVVMVAMAYADGWSPVGLSLNSKYHFPSWETPVYGLRLGLKAEDLVVRGISLCIVDWQEAAWSWKGHRRRPENMEPAFSGVNVALVGSAVRAEAFAVQVSGLASFAGFDSSVVVQVSGVGCCAVGNGFCLSVAPFLCTLPAGVPPGAHLLQPHRCGPAHGEAQAGRPGGEFPPEG